MDFPFISDILNFFQSIWEFIYNGIYDFTQSALTLMTLHVMLWYVNSLIFLATIAFDAFNSLLSELGVSQMIEQKYNSLPPDVISMLGFFGIPEFVTIIFSAIGTRFAMRFVPIIGK